MLFRSNDMATTEIYTTVHTLSLHDALPIWQLPAGHPLPRRRDRIAGARDQQLVREAREPGEHLVDAGQRAPWVHAVRLIRCPSMARRKLATRHVDWCRSARR